jgi:hypothetical protein
MFCLQCFLSSSCLRNLFLVLGGSAYLYYEFLMFLSKNLADFGAKFVLYLVLLNKIVR